MVGKDKYFPGLLGSLSNKIAAEMPSFLKSAVLAQTAKCSYPKLAIGEKTYDCNPNPLISKYCLYFININGKIVYLLPWSILGPPIALCTVRLSSN